LNNFQRLFASRAAYTKNRNPDLAFAQGIHSGAHFWRERRFDDASSAASVAEVIARAGRIDALVNNAGITLMGAAEETSMAEAERLFATNAVVAALGGPNPR